MSNDRPDDAQRQLTHNRLKNDFLYFAQCALKIKPKVGPLVPFVYNKPQLILHTALERQLAEIGMVRAIVIKGRQQGCSTYIDGRFYHRCLWVPQTNTTIVSHQAVTTDALFGMVHRYYDESPPALKPRKTTDNNRTLAFENGSTYLVGTNGSGAFGRGVTTQLLHGSEVAYYEKPDDFENGVLQSVADMPGTEVILESTANGMGNYFHQLTQIALKGKSLYRVIFIPWYESVEYRLPVGSEPFVRSEEEEDLARIYKLDDEQLNWRRNKIAGFQDRLWKFRQEYPCNLQEAFQSSGSGFFMGEDIEKARRNRIYSPQGAVVIGCDPARQGDDTVIVIRKGRAVLEMFVYDIMDEMTLAGKLIDLIKRYDVQKCFIDAAHGHGTVDRMTELGFGNVVQAVHFGAKASEDRFLNKRVEMYWSLREWLTDIGGASIPDDDALVMDLSAIPEEKETSSGLLQLEAKSKIKKTLGRSPDRADALALTFAYPVRSNDAYAISQAPTIKAVGGPRLHSPSTMLNRIRSRRY